LMAGGEQALVRSVEGAEDDESQAAEELARFGLSRADCVLGLAASGRTPYVVGALRFAQQQGAWTAALTTNPEALLGQFANVHIAPLVGSEVITGSTRMKSGTAQKLVLNMISTAVMVRSGYVLGNRMVNVQLTNEKLRDRAERIVAEIAGVDRGAAAESLAKAGDVRVAVLMMVAHLELDEAKALLTANQGVLRAALAVAGKGV